MHVVCEGELIKGFGSWDVTASKSRAGRLQPGEPGRPALWHSPSLRAPQTEAQDLGLSSGPKGLSVSQGAMAKSWRARACSRHPGGRQTCSSSVSSKAQNGFPVESVHTLSPGMVHARVEARSACVVHPDSHACLLVTRPPQCFALQIPGHSESGQVDTGNELPHLLI